MAVCAVSIWVVSPYNLPAQERPASISLSTGLSGPTSGLTQYVSEGPSYRLELAYRPVSDLVAGLYGGVTMFPGKELDTRTRTSLGVSGVVGKAPDADLWHYGVVLSYGLVRLWGDQLEWRVDGHYGGTQFQPASAPVTVFRTDGRLDVERMASVSTVTVASYGAGVAGALRLGPAAHLVLRGGWERVLTDEEDTKAVEGGFAVPTHLDAFGAFSILSARLGVEYRF